MEGRSRRQKYTRGHGPAATEDSPAAGSSRGLGPEGPAHPSRTTQVKQALRLSLSVPLPAGSSLTCKMEVTS